MKKALIFSALVLIAIGTQAFAQSSPETMTRIRDATTQTAVADVTALGTNQAATQYGLNVAAGCYYYAGTQWYQWTGALANSDAIAPATTRAPYIQGMGLYFDGTNWRRMVGEAWDASMTATPTNSNVNAFNVFYNLDGTVGRRWEGETLDTSMTAAPVSPNVNALNAFYNTDGAATRRWEGETADTSMTAAPICPNVNAFNAFYNIDGSVMRRWEGQTLDDVGTDVDPTVPWVGSYNLFYDTGANVAKRWYGAQVADNLGFPYAPYTIGLTTFADGGNYRKWTGDTGNDGVGNTTVMPYVHSFLHTYHAAGVTWDRLTASTSADNLSATPQGIDSIDYAHFYQSEGATTQFRRWTGETVDDSMTQAPVAPFTASYSVFGSLDSAISRRVTGEAYDSSMTATPTNPNVNSFTTFYNGSATQYWQGSVLSSETTANTTYAPHAKDFLHCYDSVSGSWRWVNAIDTQADGQATTLNGMVTSSLNYGFNGTTFDLLRIGASNELQTTDVANRPGEDATNDWRKVKVQSIGTYAPAATTGTAVTGGAGLTVVLAAVEILDLTSWCIYLKNTDGGGAAFNDAEVSVSPNNSDWISLTFTDCDSLADGAICVYCASNSGYRYVRARVSSASDITVSAWITGNNG